MGISYFYEQGTIGMGQKVPFYGNRAEFIVLSAVFSHHGLRKVKILYTRNMLFISAKSI
jgi:hypothetical protein